MKKTRKAAVVLLAMVVAFSLMLPAFAAEQTYTITITNDASGHTYAAYQIFSGVVSDAGLDGAADSGPILSNIDWGDGVNSTALPAALASANIAGLTFTADMSASQVAAELEGASAAQLNAFAAVVDGHLATPSGTSSQGSGKYSISGLPAGYYLVIDAGETAAADGSANYIVQVLGNVTMAPKTDDITSYKKVRDINDSTGSEYTAWQDSADHDIGDAVPFQLTAILPDNLLDYETYELVFHDVQSAGLTFNNDVTVRLSTNGGASYTEVDSGLYSVAYSAGQTQEDGCTFELVISDVTLIDGIANGAYITVEYTSSLNDGAVIGAAGNPNTMHVSYNNGQGTGRTPDDTVIVFTYKVEVDKVDEESEPLAGAQFTLEKYSAADEEWIAVDRLTVGDDNATFTFTGLDDGQYRLTETATPNGYNSIEPIVFTVTAEHQIESDTPALTSLNGTADGEIELEFTSDMAGGSLSATVVNQSGATLPETGGVGTTIFYVAGCLLVVGAAIALIAKKRAGV